jgi:hypothetical protein
MKPSLTSCQQNPSPRSASSVVNTGSPGPVPVPPPKYCAGSRPECEQYDEVREYERDLHRDGSCDKCELAATLNNSYQQQDESEGNGTQSDAYEQTV